MDRNEVDKSHRPSSGSITFYSTDFSNLEKRTNNYQEFKRFSHPIPPPSGFKSMLKTSSSKRTNGNSSSPSSAGNTRQIKDWINQKSLATLINNHNAEIWPTRLMYDRVLNNEENFVQGIEEFLKEQELLNQRKKEVLHKKWHEQVYVPIRKEIEKTFEKRFEAIDSARRNEYDRYLDYGNRKGHVFLDVISPEEYDPLKLYARDSLVALRATTPRLKDPILSAERLRIEEEKTKIQCETGELPTKKAVLSRRRPTRPLVPLGRDGSKHSSWLALSIGNMDGPDRSRSRQRMANKAHQTVIDFATWSNTAFEPEIVDRELRIQKKRRFEVPSTMPTPGLDDLLEKTIVRFAEPPVTSTS